MDQKNSASHISSLDRELNNNVISYTYFFQDFVFMIIALKEYLKRKHCSEETVSETTKLFNECLKLYEDRKKFEMGLKRSIIPLCSVLDALSRSYRKIVTGFGYFDYLQFLREYAKNLEEVHLVKRLAKSDNSLVKKMMESLNAQIENMDDWEEDFAQEEDRVLWHCVPFHADDLLWYVEDIYYDVSIPKDHKRANSKLIFQYVLFLQDFAMEMQYWHFVHAKVQQTPKEDKLWAYYGKLRGLAKLRRKYETSGEFLAKCNELSTLLKEIQRDREPPANQWHLYYVYLEFLKTYAEKLAKAHQFLKHRANEEESAKARMNEISEKMDRFAHRMSKDLENREEVTECKKEMDVLKRLIANESEYYQSFEGSYESFKTKKALVKAQLREIAEKVHQFEQKTLVKDLEEEEIEDCVKELDMLKHLVNVELQIPE
ncbi:hypothetical protein AVEN_118839-1 [Araneus ventricosus]|uniref:Uncharacterized protein n=2 Tax=Araneus ventricosus TaxID=182803 RepID=A0A4Y1ZKF1_ARAVE|nr:hypothetical protein AVEN_118839-1 [Araneus ventricosus]